MPEFVKINEFGMVENVFMANSLEEATAIAGERCYPNIDSGIGYMFIAEENRFVSQEEYANIMKPIWEAEIKASQIKEQPVVEG